MGLTGEMDIDEVFAYVICMCVFVCSSVRLLCKESIDLIMH